MSNSKLATYIDTSTSNWNNRNSSISRITIHHAAGVGNCDMLSRVLKSGRQCSWNYGIGNDGVIGLFVDESHRAWTSSNSDNDDKAITIEVCNSTGSPDWKISDAAWNSLIDLCVDICQRNNIKKLTYTGKLSGSNLTMHQWFKSTNCPGPYLKARFPKIRDTVNTKLNKGYKPKAKGNKTVISNSNTSNSSDSKYISSGTVDPRSIINTSAITPYVATLSPGNKDVSYDKLKSLGVVGVMLYGGSLYDSTHMKRKYYVSSTLSDQVSKADKADMPYALYVDVRSRSRAEAEQECEELYYVISKFPPELGLWLKLNFTKSRYTNNKILEVYRDNLEEWGLKDKIGLYVTRKQLSTVNWDNFYEDFWLWIVDHVSNISNVKDKLLEPEFFMLNKKGN